MDSTSATHEVTNQPEPLEDYNAYLTDRSLRDAVDREGASWADATLAAHGATVGAREWLERARQANVHPPALTTHDRYGHRVDRVDFHPAYHELMQLAFGQGLHAAPWTNPQPGAHVARAAAYYLQYQLEPGHGCPVTMSFAATPMLRLEPSLQKAWESAVHTFSYDGRDAPAGDKAGLTVGMAMTEKQGGSDVASNATTATPLGPSGPGHPYQLIGHKYFVSAPMSDLFLMLAQARGGLSCFLVPRWTDDDVHNAIEMQQLKDKLGNRANASAEVELRGALGWLVGEEGRGVRNIIQMVALTRMDCMIGSTALMRQAIAQAIHHTHHRSAFGRTLSEQPIMQNVLADLALENEAALALTMRTARALDQQDDPHEAALFRLLTPVGKYWICKRTPSVVYEAMECLGGGGFMETSVLPRLYREAPVNAIWEGSGNIQCLDVLRAIVRDPDTRDAFLTEIRSARGLDDALDELIDTLPSRLDAPEEFAARRLVADMALAAQARLLCDVDTALAEAFCRARLGAHAGPLFGLLPMGSDCEALIDRARPAE